MSTYLGTVFEGSTTLQTSTAGAEILTSGNRYTDFSFKNDQICSVSINGGDYIYLRANQGFTAQVIKSLKIQENSITFTWIGTKL